MALVFIRPILQSKVLKSSLKNEESLLSNNSTISVGRVLWNRNDRGKKIKIKIRHLEISLVGYLSFYFFIYVNFAYIKLGLHILIQTSN